MNSKIFWKTLQGGSLAGWLYIFAGAVSPFEIGALKILWWCLMPTWAILHPMELPVSLPIGRGKGLRPEWTFVMTLLFGFTWWLPLKRGILDD